MDHQTLMQGRDHIPRVQLLQRLGSRVVLEGRPRPTVLPEFVCGREDKDVERHTCACHLQNVRNQRSCSCGFSNTQNV